jgi:hypothetical protein
MAEPHVATASSTHRPANANLAAFGLALASPVQRGRWVIRARRLREASGNGNGMKRSRPTGAHNRVQEQSGGLSQRSNQILVPGGRLRPFARAQAAFEWNQPSDHRLSAAADPAPHCRASSVVCCKRRALMFKLLPWRGQSAGHSSRRSTPRNTCRVLSRSRKGLGWSSPRGRGSHLLQSRGPQCQLPARG